ncbi:MAG: hypothetical protein WCC60_03395 [Ilumatobacteraceae bacterium]
MARRLSSLLVAFVVALSLSLTASTRDVAAADGLSFSNTTTYTLDALSGLVHVQAEISLTNTIPDQRDGNYINRRYFTGFSLPVPVGAVNQVATSSRGKVLDLAPRLVEGNTDFYVFDIDLASDLYYQQSAQVAVTYDITGMPPRSENPSRVNGAYAAFDAFGIGDEGKVTVRVVVPPGFSIDTFGDDAVVSQENGNTVYTATDIPNPDEFNIFVSARNDGGLQTVAASTADGDDFTLRSWPGDTEWQSFVTTQLHDGVPVLSRLVGQPWPIHDTVEVREAYTPYLYGYAGWFSASDKEIEIGEDLDQEVVLHELSHAWFNDEWFADRWLNEGFAQAYSNKAVAEMGGVATAPDEISDTDAGRVNLNEWDDPDFTDGADAVEDYGYNTSFSVVQQILAEIGDANMRRVLAAVTDRTIAYTGDAVPERYDVVTDWRRFLDLVEEIAGAKGADELIDRYVVTTSQSEWLDERTSAREAYQRLVEHGHEWAPPYLVREKMSAWSFGAATRAIDAAENVLALRDELDEKTAALGAGYPDDLESGFEAADKNLDEATKDVQEQIDTADRVLAAVAADAENDGLLDKVGLLGTNLPALLDEAKAALTHGDHEMARSRAQQVIDTVDGAPDVGRRRSLWVAGGALLTLMLLAALVVQLRRRRRNRRFLLDEQATSEADEPTVAEAAEPEGADTCVDPEAPDSPRP